MKKIDITGLRFERVVVLGDSERFNGRRMVLCRCDCGVEFSTDPRSLTQGSTKSCGCLHRERVSQLCKSRVKHGYSGSKEYDSWIKMKSRCTNPKNKKYPDYGGRGISVCSRWDSSFEEFIADMGDMPEGCNSIDRIDVNGGYCKENCRWSYPEEQSRNKRNTIKVIKDGAEIPLAQACREAGINYRTAIYRINSGGDWLTPRKKCRPISS